MRTQVPLWHWTYIRVQPCVKSHHCMTPGMNSSTITILYSELEKVLGVCRPPGRLNIFNMAYEGKDKKNPIKIPGSRWLSGYKHQSLITCSLSTMTKTFSIIIPQHKGGPRWQSGNTLASHLWGRGSILGTATSGKAASCLPLVGSLQYRTLTNCMYWFPLPFQLAVVIWPVQCWKGCKTPNK